MTKRRGLHLPEGDLQRQCIISIVLLFFGQYPEVLRLLHLHILVIPRILHTLIM